jgi:CPA2 family monovalent cation:H+ antiporter-2
MIRTAQPAYAFIYKHLPGRLLRFLDGYAEASEPVAAKESLWKKYLSALGQIVLIYGILCIAICILGFQLLLPLAEKWIPGIWSHVAVGVTLLLGLAPFLRAILVKKNKSEEFKALWNAHPANRAPLAASIVIRFVLVMGFIFYVLGRLFHVSVVVILLLALAVVAYLMFGRWAKSSAHKIEETFFTNLNSREKRAEYLGQKKPEYASRLLDKDLHLSDFDLPADTEWAGCTLRELKLSQRFGIQVVAILRGGKRLNIPVADTRIFPHDRIQVVGSDAGLEAFGTELGKSSAGPLPEDFADQEVVLRRLPVTEDSPLANKTLKDSSIRNRYRCLVVGVEKEDGALHIPNPTIPFEKGDNLWIVGEKKDVESMMTL